MRYNQPYKPEKKSMSIKRGLLILVIGLLVLVTNVNVSAQEKTNFESFEAMGLLYDDIAGELSPLIVEWQETGDTLLAQEVGEILELRLPEWDAIPLRICYLRSWSMMDSTFRLVYIAVVKSLNSNGVLGLDELVASGSLRGLLSQQIFLDVSVCIAQDEGNQDGTGFLTE